ncbi:MAG: MFS transporter, partial [Acidimicrobiales bacterium]
TASIVDLRPDDRTGKAATAAMIASNLGLGVGALAAGLFAQYVPDPSRVLFLTLAAVFGLGLLGCRRLPRISRTHAQPHLGLVRLALPQGRVFAFFAYSSGLAVAWAIGGLYLSLGPSIAALVSGSTSRLAGALSVSLLGFVGAGVAAGGRRWSEQRQIAFGSPVLVLGLTLVMWSCVAGSWSGFLCGSLVLAWGWGLLNIGCFRLLVALSSPENRAGVLATVYVVSYFAFSIPTIIAGILTDHLGLRSMTVIFGSTAGSLVIATSFTILYVVRAGTRSKSGPLQGVPLDLPVRTP